MNEITINIATHSDISSIANIEISSFSDPWSQNAIKESLLAGTTFYIANLNGITVGYMGLSKIAGEGYVTNIAVLPDRSGHRNQPPKSKRNHQRSNNV